MRRQAGDVVAVDQDRARGRLLEAGDHPQRRRLAAAARAEQGEELALGDVEIHLATATKSSKCLDTPCRLHADFAHTRPLLIRQATGARTPLRLSRRGCGCKWRKPQNVQPHLYNLAQRAYTKLNRIPVVLGPTGSYGYTERRGLLDSWSQRRAASVGSRRREMASTDTAIDHRRGHRPPGGGQAPPLDALHAHGRLRRDNEVPIIARGEGCYVYDEHGKRYLDGLSGAVLRQRRPRPRRARRGRGAPGRRARLLHALELRPPAGDRARGADRHAGPGRPQPRLLHLRRLGGGRVGDQARARNYHRGPATPRRQVPHPRGRLPRHHARGALRRPGSPALRTEFEPLVPGGMHVAEHQQLPLARGPRPALGRRRRSRSGSSSRVPRRSPR